MRRFLPVLAALLTLAMPRFAEATSIVPQSWEELVVDADFIGIVECETAGGIVARYRVIETWKGDPKAGDRMAIAQGLNEWEPVFPIALCGERFLVMAYKSAIPARITRLEDGRFPPWWRSLPSDYGVSCVQGYLRLPLEEDDEPLFQFSSKCRTLAEFKKDVDRLLARTPPDLELYMLRALSKSTFSEPRTLEGQPPVHADDLLRSIGDATDPADVANQLLEFGRKHTDAWGQSVVRVLEQGGREKTLEIVEPLPVDRFPLAGKESRAYFKACVAERIRRRLRLPLPSGIAHPGPVADPPAPATEDLEKARAALASEPAAPGIDDAIVMLTRHDPGRMAAYLAEWTCRKGEPYAFMRPYVIGSYFGYQCGRDRDRNLRTLLKAKEPFVRVAGAVYLCFEQKADGMAALEECAALEGDPGAWAALVRASRGEKSAVPRALRVLAEEGESHMGGVVHRILQKRLKVLLSNTARASDLPQPAPPSSPQPERVEGTIHFMDPSPEEVADYFKRLHRYYADWWEENQKKAVLTDPWLPLLELQKVD